MSVLEIGSSLHVIQKYKFILKICRQQKTTIQTKLKSTAKMQNVEQT